MGGLRPIGSEKLQGMDKINRILEISRYNEHLPNPVNESSSNEYSITMADGNTYEIIKEKSGYIIKQRINESLDYIAPMKNRKYYSSYSQAFKRLNLMAKEINTLTENTEGISLFNEDKKYVLKMKKSKLKTEGDDMTDELMEQPAAPAPAPAPAPVASPAPSPAPEEAPVEEPMPEEMPAEEPEMDNEETPEEEVTFKTIQKLTGKLAQKLRDFGGEEEEMTSNDVKYVINSILSALDLSILDEDDVDEILNRFEGDEEMPEDEYSSEDMEEPMPEEEPVSPEGEMEEMMSLDDSLESKIPSVMSGQYKKSLNGEMMEFDDEDYLRSVDDNWEEEDKDDFSMRGNFFNDEDEENEWEFEDEMEDEMYRPKGSRLSRHFTHGTFSESKVDQIINKYFTLTEDEKQPKEETISESVKSQIKNLSESVRQERSALKFLEENKGTKFVGLTNKGNLVFKKEDKQYKISPKGGII